MGGTSKACCISRGAPSPDGNEPPRPIPIAADSDLTAVTPVPDRAPVLSWPSRFSKPEDEADFQAIFANDVSDGESSIISSRLTAVKTKLRKHLSRDSALSKSRLRSSVGTSEEEVARREELKRIRKKRIQEELGDERVYDDDARSVTASAVEAPYSQGASHHDYAQDVTTVINSVMTSRRHSFSTLEQSASSPEKASESGRRRRSSVPEIPPPPILRPQKLPSIDDPRSRRTSWRLSFSSERRASCLRALSQEYPAAPVPELVKTPEEAPSTPTTAANYLKWLRGQGLRLPLSGSNDHLHITGAHPEGQPGSVSPHDNSGFGGVDGQKEQANLGTPLHMLRISQRLASGDSRSQRMSPDFSPVSAIDAFGQADNNPAPAAPLDRHSRFLRMTSSGNSGTTETKISPNWGSVVQQDGASSFYLSEAELPLKSEKRPTWQSRRSVSALTSSADTTDGFLAVPPVTLTLPDQAATIDLTNAPTPSKKLSKSPLKRTDSDITITSLRSVKNFFKSNNDRKSSVQDDLDVELRHPHILGQRRTSSVVTSRFVEEFDEPDPKQSSRSSFLSTLGLPRLGKLSTRSYDGASSIEHANSVPKRKKFGHTLEINKAGSPTRSVSERTPSTPSLYKTGAMDSTEVMWNKAIRQSIGSRAQAIQREFEMVPPSPMTKPSLLFPPSAKGLSTGLDDIADEIEEDTNETTRLTFREPIRPLRHKGQNRLGSEAMNFGQSALVDQLQLQELAEEDANAQTLGRSSPASNSHSPMCKSPLRHASSPALRSSPVSRTSGGSFARPATPPKSWARFPSHTRGERCESAGKADKVSSTDFATIVLEDGTETFVTGYRKRVLHRHDDQKDHHHHNSLPERLTMKIRTSFDRLRTKHSTAQNDAMLGRRSSTSVGGHLAEPELEMLPAFDVRPNHDVLKVEIEAAEQMRLAERRKRMMHYGGSDGSDSMVDGPGDYIDFGAGRIGRGDARYYEDCVMPNKTFSASVATLEEFAGTSMLDDKEASKRSKYGTWSGRERIHLAERASLRQSTVDFTKQVEFMEKMERERALKAVEQLLTRT